MTEILKNPLTENLYKDALDNGCSKSITNALIAYSGNITGRLPQFKRVVKNNVNNPLGWLLNRWESELTIFGTYFAY